MLTKDWSIKGANSMVLAHCKMFLFTPWHRSFRQVYSNNDQGSVKPSGTFLGPRGRGSCLGLGYISHIAKCTYIPL